MKVLLHSWVAAPSLVGRYLHAQARLRCCGIEADVRTGTRPDELDLDGYDVAVSHNLLPDAVRAQLPGRVFGGKRMSRPEHLTLLAAHGFPVMEWTTVANQAEGLALFDAWNVDRIILKRSFTSGGEGFHVLTPNQPQYMTWDFEKDVLCKEVNPNNGHVYKAELFGGHLIAGYVLKKQPISARLISGDACPQGFRQLAPYRQKTEEPGPEHRELCQFCDSERQALEQLSVKLTEDGFGYVSVDLMRRPDGVLVAIELNTSRVVTWWTEKFPGTRERFAAALLDLVKGLHVAHAD